MIQDYIFRPKRNLQNLKVWLSGAIPERETWSHDLIDQDILEFIAYFSAMIFSKGGTIVHGSHPLFTPVIVAQAKKFCKNRQQLRLYVSSMWGSAEIVKYSDYANIIEIESYKNSRNPLNSEERNKSLSILRKKMALASNCIVAIGGRLHSDSRINPGVMEELEIAKKFRIPSYILGGFGGEARRVGDIYFNNPFLRSNEKKEILFSNSISFLPSTIVKLLERDRNMIAAYRFTNRLLRTDT